MPGVIVERGASRTTLPVPGRLSVFLLGTASWGPIDEPIRVNGEKDFKNKLGSPISSSWLYQSVKQYADERGISDLYVTRISSKDAQGKNLALKSKIVLRDTEVASEDTLEFEAIFAGTEGDKIKVKIEEGSSAALFTIRITHVDYLDKYELYRDVTFDKESSNYVEKIVNYGSELVRVKDLESSNTNKIPAFAETHLSGGTNGDTNLTVDDWIGNEQEETGIYSFNLVKSTRFILSIPGNTSRKAIKAMCQYGLDRQVGYVNAMVPIGLSDKNAIHFKNGTGEYAGDNVGPLHFENLSLYKPWVLGKNALTGDVTLIPPEAAIAANDTKTDLKRGVAKPAAGTEDGLISKITAAGVEDDVNSTLLNENNICSIKAFPGYGVLIWGARTTSENEDEDWSQKQITRTMQYFTQWCFDSFLKYVFEPINDATYEAITSDGLQELGERYAQGWLDDDGTGDPDEAYFFQCDQGNNTSETRKKKEIVIDFGARPVGATELIRVRLSLHKGLS